MVALQAGSPPDAAVAFESMVQEYARAGAVVDLEDYLSAGASPLTRESRADLFPAFLDGGRLDAFGRRLLAFPFARSLAVQYYNEDLLGAAGHSGTATLSVEEFRRQVAAATRRDSTRADDRLRPPRPRGRLLHRRLHPGQRGRAADP